MIGHASCRGCMYSGHPHNEDCPKAMHNKYQPVDGVAPTAYYHLSELFRYLPEDKRDAFEKLLDDHRSLFYSAKGSSGNHQAWEGGYIGHIVETMNIAKWLYRTSPRTLPFKLADALEIMFLHDLEKPFKESPDTPTLIGSWNLLLTMANYDQGGIRVSLSPKQFRREFRNQLICKYGIQLSPEQENALRYVEGVPDSEYTPHERTMNELAAFCHCCDILSARLWFDRGLEGVWE